jgi:serine/threonine-protein kinase
VGPRHPGITTYLDEVATDLRKLERFGESLEFRKRELALETELHGADSEGVAIAEANLGATYGDMKDYPAALLHLRKSLPALKKKIGIGTPRYAAALSNVAYAESNVGSYAQALEHYRESLAIYEREHKGDIDFNLIGMGECQLALARPAAAVPILERALRLESEEKADSEDIAEVKFLLARALAASNQDRARARRLALEARGAYKPTQVQEIAAIDAWLLRHGPLEAKGRAPPR